MLFSGPREDAPTGLLMTCIGVLTTQHGVLTTQHKGLVLSVMWLSLPISTEGCILQHKCRQATPIADNWL